MKKFFNFSLVLFPFFLTGFLAAISAFILQTALFFFSEKIFSPESSLFLFVLLEELLKLLFWSNSVRLFFSLPILPKIKLFILSFFFAGGFWFLEIFFLKMKIGVYPPFFASAILFSIHWLTSLIIGYSDQKWLQKKHVLFFLLFFLALIIHSAYNWSITVKDL